MIRRRCLLLLCAAAATLSLILLALRLGDGLQAWGGSGEYSEHTTRLLAWREWDSHAASPLLRRLGSTDGGYPPGVHLVSLAFEPLLGADAVGAQRIGAFWLLTLAFAVSWLTRTWTGRSQPALLAGSLIPLLPAVHAASTRYSYEVPLVAMIWLSWAALAAAERRGSLAWVGVGLLFALSCLTKWTAIPMLGAVVLTEAGRTRRVAPSMVALLVAASLLALWFHNRPDLGSFGSAAGEMLAHGVSSSAPRGFFWPFDEFVARGLDRVLALTGGRLVWYPLAWLASVVSPLGGLVLGYAVWPALRADRSIRWAAATFVGSWWVFLLLCVPVLDARFLLVLLPLAAVLAGISWREARRHGAIAVVFAVLLLIQLDFHRAAPSPWNRRLMVPSGPRSLGQVEFAGIGLASSVEGRGWLRADQRGDAGNKLRARLWSRVLAQAGVESLGWVEGVPLIRPPADDLWLRYEVALLARLGGRRLDLRVMSPERWLGQPDLFLTPADRPSVPAELGSGWVLAESVVWPGGGVTLWRAPGPSVPPPGGPRP